MKRTTKLYASGFAALALLSFASCINDDSVGEVNPISEISASQSLAAAYNVDRWDTLRISAPEVQQSNTAKPLSYRWEINGKTVSTEKDLVYECRDYASNLLCRLTISNEDGNYYRNFRLNVQYSYRKGLYILAEENGAPILTYVPAETNKSIQRDVLKQNNPDLTYNGAPTAAGLRMDIQNKQEFYIATGSPSRVYRFDGHTMQAVSYAEAASTVQAIYANPSGNVNNAYWGSLSTVVEDGMYSQIDGRSLSFLLTTGNARPELRKLSPNVKLSNQVLSWARTTDNDFNGRIFYDESSKSLLVRLNSNHEKYPEKPNPNILWKKLFPEQTEGLDLTGMAMVNNYHDVAVFLKNPTTNKYYHIWVYPGGYDRYVASRRNAADLKQERVEIPSTAGLKDDSKFVGATTTNLVYYSSDNKIYAYNVLSKGNFPTEATYRVGDNEKIVSLILSNDESELFVGTMPTSGDTSKGSIYCFDLSTRTQKWHRAGVTGKIVQMLYRK